MPMRSLGRPSINLRVTSRTPSSRVASWPPIVKSFANIEFETSSTSMMSMPLASTWVRLLPSCGRASAMTKKASAAKTNARKNFPARAALCLPIARSVVVDEKVNAAAGPALPRRYASSGMTIKSKSNHGRANVSAVFAGKKSNSCKFASSYETKCFLEQQLAIGRSRVVARELDQIAAIEKIGEERFRVFGERDRVSQRDQKLDRSLAGER